MSGLPHFVQNAIVFGVVKFLLLLFAYKGETETYSVEACLFILSFA